MKLFTLIILVLLVLQTQAIAKEPKNTVTVVPFVSLDGEDTAWLGKAISDLLAGKISSLEQFTVLDRQRLQTFLKEMELQEAGFTESDTAQKLARLAKINKAIIGNYTLSNNSITINALIIDAQTGEVQQRNKVQGELDSLQQLIAKLTQKIAKDYGIKISEEETKEINVIRTRSLSATEYFYKGLDLYDNGEYEKAFGQFLSSSKQDKKYYEATLWAARMLEYTGQIAQAAALYRSIETSQPEGADALFFAAKLLEKSDNDAAIAIYHKLAENKQYPHAFYACFELGNLYYEAEQYGKAFDSFECLIKKHPLLKGKNENETRFFNWSNLDELEPEAVIHIAKALRYLGANAEYLKRARKIRGIFVVDPDNPVIEEKYATTESLFPNKAVEKASWYEDFYAVIIPEGYQATSLDIQMTGKLFKPDHTHSYGMRILPFPIPHNHYNSWFGALYGQTPEFDTVKKSISFRGEYKQDFAIHLMRKHSDIQHWKVTLHLISDTKIVKTSFSVTPPDRDFSEVKHVATLDLNELMLSGVNKAWHQTQKEQRAELSMINNFNGEVHLAVVKGDLEAGQTDLWLSKDFLPLEKLPINSSSNEFYPKLLIGEDGKIRLFWNSNRRGEGWELWYSILGEKWSHPQRLPIEGAETLIHYDVIQDKQGRWVVAYADIKTHQMVFLVTDHDGNWQQTSALKTYTIRNPALTVTHSGRYLLALINDAGSVNIMQSNDLITWERKTSRSTRQISFSAYPMTFIPKDDDSATLLLSDQTFGLRYAQVYPDKKRIHYDLVKDAFMQSYAAAFYKGTYLIALKNGDTVDIKAYRHLASSHNQKKQKGFVYIETMYDNAGNRWDRYFPRGRFITPDTTAIAAANDDKVWWGIESGMIEKKGGKFGKFDVSMGFFYNNVTSIEFCGDKVYFSSEYKDEPIVSMVTAGNHFTQQSDVRVLKIPEVESSISDIYCRDGAPLFELTSGKAYSIDGKPQASVSRAPHTASHFPCSIAVDKQKKTSEGTFHICSTEEASHGLLYQQGSQVIAYNPPDRILTDILDFDIGDDGIIWISTEFNGAYRLERAQ